MSLINGVSRPFPASQMFGQQNGMLQQTANAGMNQQGGAGLNPTQAQTALMQPSQALQGGASMNPYHAGQNMQAQTQKKPEGPGGIMQMMQRFFETAGNLEAKQSGTENQFNQKQPVSQLNVIC